MSSFTLPSWEESFKFNYAPSQGSTTGGNMFDWGSMLGGVAGGIGSIFGASKTSSALKSAANKGLAGAVAGLMEARKAKEGELGYNIWQNVFNTTVAPELAYGLEKRAKLYDLNFLEPKESALLREEGKRTRAGLVSDKAKELKQFENQLALERSIGEKRAALSGLFGDIA